MTDDNMRQVVFPENDWRNLLITELRRTGGDPSQLFEILEGIVQKRAWEYLTDENGAPVGSLRRLIEEKPPVGAGMPADKVMRLLEIEHRYEYGSTDWRDRMAALRDTIRRELGAEPLARPGRPSNEDKPNNIRVSTYGDNPSYLTARLQRDRPDLADKVLSGEMSAHAAALEAGFVPPKVSIRLDDPEKAARTIGGKVEPERALEIADWLYKLFGNA